jgi:DNA-binding MarR family transcriptional regulator
MNEDRVQKQTTAQSDFRPSLPDFHSGPPFVLRRSQQLLTGFYNAERRAAGTDLTESQLDVLHAISLCGRPPDQIGLALQVGYDRSTLGSVIDGLVRRRLVRRTVGEDRRRRTLVLAAGASDAMAIGSACARRSQEKLFKGLSKAEIASLLDLLEAVAMKRDTPAPQWRPSSAVGKGGGRGGFAELYRSPHFLLRRCMQIVTAFVAAAVAPLGLSSALQLVVLYVVAACEPVDQAKVGRILWIDKSSVSLVLSLLESEGLIRRVVDSKDQRRLLSSITPLGMSRLEVGVSGGDRVDDQIFEGLPSGTRERFTDALGRVVAAQGGYVP